MTLPLAGLLALVLPLVAPGGSSSDPKDGVDVVTLKGRAVELTRVLKAAGVESDAEPIAKQVVVQGEDGTITPLLSDEASRALFQDERLRNRPIEVMGWRRPGLPYVQVVSFKVEEDGRMRTPEYFCEVCTISVRSPQICPCCQGPMELRMKPES